MSKYDGLIQAIRSVELSGPEAMGTAIVIGFVGYLVLRLTASKPEAPVFPSSSDDIAPAVVMTVVFGGFALLALLVTGFVDMSSSGGSGCAAREWRGRGLECVD